MELPINSLKDLKTFRQEWKELKPIMDSWVPSGTLLRIAKEGGWSKEDVYAVNQGRYYKPEIVNRIFDEFIKNLKSFNDRKNKVKELLSQIN